MYIDNLQILGLRLVLLQYIHECKLQEEGKAIAKTRAGFKEGRPKAYTEQQITDALEYLKDNSYTKTEKAYGISKSTLIRAKRERG